MYSKFRFNGFSNETLSSIANSAKKALKGFEFSSFLVGCTFPNSISDDGKQLLRKEFQPLLVKKLEKELNAMADFENPDIELIVNFNQDVLFIQVKPFFIGGRYKKFSRKITQTRHYCFECKGRGCKKCNYSGIVTPESVQSLIEKHALPLFECREAKFHGAGREDKDVRMLGSGRRFVLELVEPKKRSVDLKALEEEINSVEGKKIEVSGLRKCSKKEIPLLKAGKNNKVYEVVVLCEKEIDVEKALRLQELTLIVKQRTPLRVVSRRSDKMRERKAKILSVEILSQKKAMFRIEAEAGLYVKEFVSGDNDRTNPCLSVLLENKCNCTELDVIEIKES